MENDTVKTLSSLISLKHFYNNGVLHLTNAVRSDNQLLDYAENTIVADSADRQHSRNEKHKDVKSYRSASSSQVKMNGYRKGHIYRVADEILNHTNNLKCVWHINKQHQGFQYVFFKERKCPFQFWGRRSVALSFCAAVETARSGLRKHFPGFLILGNIYYRKIRPQLFALKIRSRFSLVWKLALHYLPHLSREVSSFDWLALHLPRHHFQTWSSFP